MIQLPGLNFNLGEDIDVLRIAVQSFAQDEIAPIAAEIGAGTSEIRRMLIGRELFKETS